MRNKLLALQFLLLIQTIGLFLYTSIAIVNEGPNFPAKAKEFILSMGWMGQFALDFQCYLILSALWIAWRNKYSRNSILIATAALLLGILVFAPYLLYLVSKEKGNLKRILIGHS